MNMLWMLLNIGLTYSEKIHREYLPPPKLNFSGGSLDAKDSPLELTDSKYYYISKDEEITAISELVNGVDRGTLTTDNTFEEVTNNINDNLTQYDDNTLALSHFPHTTPITKSFEKSSSSVPNVQTHKIQGKADREAFIINYDQSIAPEGYAYSYDTSNGIHGEEDGTATNGLKVKGSYSYIGDDGNLYQVEYTADENGFVPKGAHFPTAPPIPDAILKVIEVAISNKEAGIYDDGSYDDEKYGYKNYEGGYPQTYNIISSASYSPGDGNNIVKGNIINKNLYYGYNGINKCKESFENGFSDINVQQNDVNGDQTDMNNSLDKNNTLHSYDMIYNKKIQNYSSQPDLDISTNKSNKMLLDNGKSNEEFSQQSRMFKSFSSRFSGMEDNEILENIADMVTTPIPFLTPYVSRIDDDELETSDIDENHENDDSDYVQDSEISDESLENYDNGSKPSKKLEQNGSLDEKLINAPQYGDRIRNNYEILPLDDKDGYIYKKIDSPKISDTTSTAISTKTSLRVSTIPNDNNADIGQSSFIAPTLHNEFLFDTSSILNQSSEYHWPAQAVRLDNNASSIKPGVIVSSKTIQTLTPRGKFSTANRPMNTNSNYPIIYNVQTSTEIIIGEDFNGPEQPQQFDPFTGHHY